MTVFALCLGTWVGKLPGTVLGLTPRGCGVDHIVPCRQLNLWLLTVKCGLLLQLFELSTSSCLGNFNLCPVSCFKLWKQCNYGYITSRLESIQSFSNLVSSLLYAEDEEVKAHNMSRSSGANINTNSTGFTNKQKVVGDVFKMEYLLRIVSFIRNTSTRNKHHQGKTVW